MARMPERSTKKDSTKKEKKTEIVAGVDIGSTKVCAVIAQVTYPDHFRDFNELHATSASGLVIDVLGMGQAPSSGLRKGVIINIDATVEAINRAMQEAQTMAGIQVRDVYVGIAGGHISSFNSHGVVAIKDKEIHQNDVARVLDAARAVAIPPDREILHVIPQDYVIDDQDGISEPVGMSGVRLEAKVHIVTGATTASQNIRKACERSQLNLKHLVLQSLASADAVLSQDERELGVAVVDIGGGTTDIAIYVNGALAHTQVIPIGGQHITRDVAVGLRAPQVDAEKIKLRHGCAIEKLILTDENIEVASVGGRNPRIVSRKVLASIIEPRVEEILTIVKNEIARHGFQEKIASGYVITGGPTMMEGFIELAEFVFDLPVKRGIPSGITGMGDILAKPQFSTAAGLLKYAARNSFGNLSSHSIFKASINYEKISHSMKNWLKDLF